MSNSPFFTKDQKEKPAYMTSDVFNITVTTGNHAELQCTADGYPAPQYSWSKRNRGKVTIGGRFSLHAGGSLRIERVTVDDSGLYTCTATNTGQTVVSTILLEVRGEIYTSGARYTSGVSSISQQTDVREKANI